MGKRKKFKIWLNTLIKLYSWIFYLIMFIGFLILGFVAITVDVEINEILIEILKTNSFGFINIKGSGNIIVGSVLFSSLFCGMVFFSKYTLIILKFFTTVMLKLLRKSLRIYNLKIFLFIIVFILFGWITITVFSLIPLILIAYYAWWLDALYSLYCFLKNKSKLRMIQQEA